MFIDYYQIEREKAKLLENGLRVHLSLKSYGVTVKIWYPKAKKPTYHYQYKNLEKASAFIKRVTKQFDEHKATTAKYRNDRKQGDLTLADPGAIFYTSWGYDQTNVDYYQVISRKNKTVKVREIGCEQVEATSSMSQMQRPKPNAFISEVVHTKRISFYDGKPSMSVHGHHARLVQVMRFGNAEPLVTEKHYSSWYS